MSACFIHEGDLVQPGQLLAQLDASEDRVKLAQAEAALAQARRDLAEAEFRNDPSAAGQAKTRADLHNAEVTLEQQRVNESQLRAPIGGMMVTPKVEDGAGTMVHPGEGFCEIVAQDRMAAEMSVPETDLPLLGEGNSVALKLNAFPATTFKGRSSELAPKRSRTRVTNIFSSARFSIIPARAPATEWWVERGFVPAAGGSRAGGIRLAM